MCRSWHAKETRMNDFISAMQEASPTLQALVVSAGGLIGVFVTLAVFFGIIWLADRLKGKTRP